MLGQLAVLLLGGRDVPDPYPGHRDGWWMDVAKRSDMLVQPVLVNLLRSRSGFTVENAMHLVAGILQDERACSVFTEGLQTRKRTAEALRLPPQTSSKRVRPEGRPDVARMNRQSRTVTRTIVVHRRPATVPGRGSNRSAAPAVQAKTTENYLQSESPVQRAIRAAATGDDDVDDDDDDASQTTEDSTTSTVLPPSSSRAAVTFDHSMQGTYESTEDLSLLSHPAPEESTANTTAFPLVQGASPAQHASWNTGLLTPHTEAHGTVSDGS
jgi:hypothetical protein